MDFFDIKCTLGRGCITVFPDFQVCQSKDLMVKGSKFYAIWDEEAGLWSTDPYDAQRLIDRELDRYVEKNMFTEKVKVKYMSSFSSNMWSTFLKYIGGLSIIINYWIEQLSFLIQKLRSRIIFLEG